MLYYSYDNYQARRLEMVRHAQLATVTVTDGAKHCVTAANAPRRSEFILDLYLFKIIRELQTRIKYNSSLNESQNSLNSVNKRALASN